MSQGIQPQVVQGIGEKDARIAELEREVAQWKWLCEVAHKELARLKEEYDIPDLGWELDKEDYFA